jgi:cellulose synthase/poly-beta-1,6-N-acetylglucosamine synthase-like glycosyltransferase
MKKVSILIPCYNEQENVRPMSEAIVDIIEIGFLDDRRPFDIDRSIMPNTACAEKIWKDVEHKNVMVVDNIMKKVSILIPCYNSSALFLSYNNFFGTGSISDKMSFNLEMDKFSFFS